jgi:hypothetical protein
MNYKHIHQNLGTRCATVLAAAGLTLASTAPAYSAEYSRERGLADQMKGSKDGFGGATAMTGVSVPFGPAATTPQPSAGFRLGFGRAVAERGLTGHSFYQSVSFADLRFDQDGLAKARVASYDFAPNITPWRFNANGNTGNFGNGWIWALGAVGAGLLICWAADCFDGSDSDSDSDTDSDSSPGE